MAKPFASSADTTAKKESLEVLADGVCALTAEGDPNVAAIEGDDFLVYFESRETPVAAHKTDMSHPNTATSSIPVWRRIGALPRQFRRHPKGT